jgi:hypothetical protein
MNENTIRAGVVMEDGTSGTTFVGCKAVYCPTIDTTVEYGKWAAVTRPKSWCCSYQDQGDCTGDGKVNIFDLFAVKAEYGAQYPAAEYDCRADSTYDGKVNIFDLFKLKSNYGDNYGYTCPATWKDDCGPN